ncbi:MAG: hypothetical protein AB7T32_08380 [Dehalococcoidia bacterium]
MQNDNLPSILLAAGTLILVLLGSLAIAASYMGGNDDPIPAATVAVQRGPECQEPDECRIASAALRRAYNDPNACDGAGARVCLVPMGDVSKELVDAIVAHYRRQYGLVVHVAQPLDCERASTATRSCRSPSSTAT